MGNFIKVTVNTIHDIAPEKRFLIDELTIVGKFELKHDLPILKSMCNSIVDGKRTGGKLSVVDLSRSNIAEEFKNNDAINAYNWGDMKDCISLNKISLPANTHFYSSMGTYFSGCKNLESISIVGIPPKNAVENGKGYDNDGVLFFNKGKQLTLVKYPANKGYEYTIRKHVTEIGDCAFEDCQLTTLIFENPIPPTCKNKAFEGVNPVTLTIKVPKGSYDSYWVHPVYGKFRIEEMEE